MKIKLCGFSEENSLKTAISQNVDFIGFIFYQNSPRNISLSQAKTLSQLVPDNINKVSVTVDAEISFLKEIEQNLKPQFFQLHGQESIDYIKKLKEIFPNIKIIKAFNLKAESDLNLVEKYDDFVDYFLFDSKNPGSGKIFDWNLLKNLNLTKDFFLSGGLNIDNIESAINSTNAKMIDISSGIESERGKKSSPLIIEFVNKIKQS